MMIGSVVAASGIEVKAVNSVRQMINPLFIFALHYVNCRICGSVREPVAIVADREGWRNAGYWCGIAGNEGDPGRSELGSARVFLVERPEDPIADRISDIEIVVLHQGLAVVEGVKSSQPCHKGNSGGPGVL